jgi:rRNA biogenesis protein RRP5
VLEAIGSKPVVDVSLRKSRLQGDLDDDQLPEEGALAHAYVVQTNKKGCFLRLSRKVDGRAILKELSDGYLPDPAASFQQGRLVVGKVKSVKEPEMKKKGTAQSKFTIDLDMRESVILSEDKVVFDAIEIGEKYEATVARIEDYGVFVRLANSDVTGLVHKSECSDKFVKTLSDLFSPGDLVKVIVIKLDKSKKQIGFSMKASHFQDDDSDASADEAMSDEDSDEMDIDQRSIDSDDENFAGRLAQKMELDGSIDDDGCKNSEESICDESESDDKHSNSVKESTGMKMEDLLDTNVGFDWGGLAPKANTNTAEESDDEEDESSDEDDVNKASHKSRRKHAQRLREEQEIAKREAALADGTADENPETAGDFERLLAGNPNSSELWIRYMAFHLSLSDIPAARKVAERAFQRIEFRQEREKLNVWCALLTLELKYGSEKSLQETIDRACQNNNPKHVYLRVCEMMAREAAQSPIGEESDKRAEETYAKMCKKFRSKKQVWIAYYEYLLKRQLVDKAHALSKRAMQSLPTYKHVETMSRFAQLVFEHGNAERARTLFDGLLIKYPKRLDLFFVYADKEVKHGDVENARKLFERQVTPQSGDKLKLSDKSMKSFFKKWYAFEELHGSMETRERVKEAARLYVEQTS